MRAWETERERRMVANQRAIEARDPKAIAEARKRLESIQIGCPAQMVQKFGV